MKIKLLFIYGPLNAGGAERVLLDFLFNIDKNKYDVTLCQTVYGGKLFNELPKDIKLISLWLGYNWSYKVAYRASVWFGNDFLFKRHIRKKIKEDYDVIISFLEGMPLKIHTLFDKNAKNITWVHTDLNKFRYTERIFFNKNEETAYLKMDKIVGVSDYTNKAFLKRFSGIKKTTTTVYNPIDVKKIQKLAGKKVNYIGSEFRIVVVGRLTEPKKIDRVLQVASEFNKNKISVKFTIVGDGELKEDLQNMCDELNINHLVEFVGYQSNPYPYIKNADLLLSTSAYEGFGLVLCEAMALGVPVMSTKTAGPMEIIGKNEYGVLCEHDIDSIYKALLNMINDEKYRNNYINKGFERVKDFSLEKSLNQFDTLIEELIK